MNFLKLLVLLFICNCSSSTANFHIFGTPNRDIVLNAVSIIVDNFAEENLYTTEQMYNVLSGINLKSHDECSNYDHKIRITFVPGEWSKLDSRNCIFPNSKKFKNKCLSGFFDGKHIIYVLSKNKEQRMYKTALAHEILHYFQKYIDLIQPSEEHVPKEIWEKFVGFKINKIGIINRTLKKEGL